MSRANHECSGAEMASEALDAILRSSPDQSAALGYLLGLLNGVSGCCERAKASRRGTAVVLVNVVERGLAAISADRGEQ